MEKIRIVAAVPHNDSEELEVILEVSNPTSDFMTEEILYSAWIDAHELFNLADK